MIATKFFLDMRGKSKDGKGSILIRIYKNGTSTTVATGIRVSPDCWDADHTIHIAGAEIINAELIEKKTKIDKAIAVLSLDDNFEYMSASDVKSAIFVENRIRGSHLVKDLFYEYAELSNMKEGTKIIYRLTLKKVLTFGGENVRIESINLRWLRSFDQYLSIAQSINGKAIYLRSLRAVCNYAKHTGIIQQYPFENFHIKQEETKKRNITISSLRRLYSSSTSDRNEVYRDYFFLMFFLIGINVKDLLLAKKTQIVSGRLEYIREKTNKRYSIKIEPEAARLMEKYKGKGEYLLDALDHCKHYTSFAREINSAIKEIGISENGKSVIPGITTYYARHTWATLAHELDISTDVISLALGHSPSNRTTAIYIKPDQSKVDKANRKVIDYLLKNS